MWNRICGNLIATLITAVIAMTPALRELLRCFLDELETKAAATPNKYDDIAVSVLKQILGLNEVQKVQP